MTVLPQGLVGSASTEISALGNVEARAAGGGRLPVVSRFAHEDAAAQIVVERQVDSFPDSFSIRFAAISRRADNSVHTAQMQPNDVPTKRSIAPPRARDALLAGVASPLVVIAGTVVAASAGINWAIVAIVGTVFLLYVGSLIAAARAKYLVGASLAQACRDQPPSICLLIGVGALVGGVAAVHFGHPHLFGSAWWAASGLGLAVISLLAVQYDVFDKRQRGGRFAVLTVLLVVLSAFVAETSVLDVAWSTEENVILVPGDFATAVLCAGALPGLIGLLIYLWARRRQVSESC